MGGGSSVRGLRGQNRSLKATRIAANIGKGFAVVFGIFAIITFSPILIIIAVFIYLGASQESNAMRYKFLLQDVTVGDMMSKPVMSVPLRCRSGK